MIVVEPTPAEFPEFLTSLIATMDPLHQGCLRRLMSGTPSMRTLMHEHSLSRIEFDCVEEESKQRLKFLLATHGIHNIDDVM